MSAEKTLGLLRILSMRAGEVCRLIQEEQLRNPMLVTEEFPFDQLQITEKTGKLKPELEAQEFRNPAAKIILDRHPEDLKNGRFSSITRSTGFRTREVRDAAAEILSAIPVSGDSGEWPETDIEVRGSENGWVVQILPEEGTLRLNHAYMDFADGTGDETVIDFYTDLIRRAKTLTAMIQQRNDILRSLVYYLLERQKTFVLGTGEAVPISRATTAEMLGIYLSALDIAVGGKMLLLPDGRRVPLEALFAEPKTKAPETKEPGAEKPGAEEPGAEKSETEKPEAESAGQRINAFVSEEDMELPDPDAVGSVSEICLLAPTVEMMKTNREICRIYEKNIDAFYTTLDNAAIVAEKLEQKGARVLISRKGTKKRIEEHSRIPVVDADLSLSDYIQIMEKAARVQGTIAFFSYGIIGEDVRSMCYLMDLETRFYSFYSAEECDNIVRRAIRDGVVLAIGGATSAKAAEKYGLEHITVENSPLSLLKAIETAEQILKLQKEEAAKQEALKIRLERYNLALNFTHDAVVAVDQEGRIEVMNSMAERLVGTSLESASGKKIDEVIPDTRVLPVLENGERKLNNVLRHRNSIWSSNIVPIVVDGTIRGAVTTFQDVRNLQEDEKNIRIKLSKKGLIAKYHFDSIQGNSPGIRNAVRMAEKYAGSDATVLICGETGTGKELFAQSIHNASRRMDGPFVAVNCGSLPRDILEAELFGYVEGAFTGASRGGKTGLFEMAHGGTIFLDEIGEMPMETQVQLLRVLQEKEIRRLGSDRVTPVDIRVIAATNRNLPEEIRAGRFRQDLFYRLSVLNVFVPPLRERREDIEPVCLYLLSRMMPVGAAERTLVREILQAQKEYDWPGNVRELENLAERIQVLLSQGEDSSFVGQMSMQHVPKHEQPHGAAPETERSHAAAPAAEKTRRAGTRTEDPGRRELLELLEQTQYEMGRTAELLGINRSTLWRRMKKFGIRKPADGPEDAQAPEV